MKTYAKKYAWWGVVGILTLALVGQFVVYRLDHPATHGHAAWYFTPVDFNDVLNHASTVVEVKVIASAPGPDIVTKLAEEPSGEDRIPTENITVEVQGVDKGQAATGQQLIIFRTGGDHPTFPNPPPRLPGSNQSNTKEPPPANVVEFMVDGDPQYQPGQLYFLALEAGPNNTMRPVSPEGRYLINADGSVTAVTDSDIAQSVETHSLKDLQAAAKGLTTIPTTVHSPEAPTGPAAPDNPGKGPFGTPILQKRVSTPPGMPTTGLPDGTWLLVGLGALGLISVGLVLRRRRRA
jgi:LPXTG-motif cell wall-anchored protein